MSSLVRLVPSLLTVAGLGLMSLNATAQTVPNFTSPSFSLGSFNDGIGQSTSVSLGDTFSASSGIVAPASTTAPYNFVDVYTFTTGSANASVDTISFNVGNAISNLQIAVFGSPTSTGLFNSPGTYVNQIGNTSGAVLGGGWGADASVTAGTSTTVTLSNVALNPGGSYTIEIRGDAPVLSGTQTASYAGNLLLTGISAVPEPQSSLLVLLGLGAVVAVSVFGRRRT